MNLPKIYFGTRSLERFKQGSVLTIGAFDGVHLGHQSIINRLRKKSAELGVPSVAVTFYPDPANYFQKEQAPAQIMSWREKAVSLLEAGVDAVVCLHFDESIRRMSAGQFVEKVLHEQLGANYVIVGDDFRFGAGREGDIQLLEKLGKALGFDVDQTETTSHGGRRISSTRVRELLQNGMLAEAAELLGKPYEVCGRVVRGHQLGRSLGFPTANIPMRRAPVAVSGVYAACVKVGNDWFKGAVNVGFRPAVNRLKKPLLEVHLLDFDNDLYGKRIRVRFEQKLREEEDFADLDALKAAIANDVNRARVWFDNNSLPVD